MAKISLFMNGAGNGNIIFGDGLENAPDKQIENGIFDILVANPPYSVKDFKQHLQLKNNEFELLDKIGLNGSEIETLFVERVAQLLKPRGIAAVILPSSILSNDSASYIGAREQLLKNFYIRGIVSFGSKTFGATGTNTVVMFLEKFNEPPKQMDMATDSVDAILGEKELTEWQDKEILDLYVAQIEQDMDTYKAFSQKTLSLDELKAIEYFKMYCLAFEESTEAKNLQKTKAYKALSEDKQKEQYLAKLYDYIRGIEAQKLYYFALVYNQKTVIIKVPADNKEQVKFLGYDWSNRKGNEGIQIITPGGKMYDDADREKEGTLAHALRQSFDGIVPYFKTEQSEYGSVVNTKDMLDYSRIGFNKALRLNAQNLPKFESRYPLSEIGKLLTLEYGKALQESLRVEGPYPVMGSNGRVGVHNEYMIKGPSIIVGRKGSAGTVIWEDKNCYPIDTTYYVNLLTDDVRLKYLYYMLSQIDMDAIVDRMGVPGLNRDNVYKVKIPIPPMSIQQQIIAECEKIDEEYNTTRMSIEDYRNKIEKLFDELEIITKNRGGYKISSIFDLITEKISGADIEPRRYVTTDTMLQQCAGIAEYDGAVPDSVTAFEENDILLSNIRPYLKKLWFATFDGGCSNDVLVMRVKDRFANNSTFFAQYLKRQQFFDYIMEDVGGVKMPRGKKSHIMNYKIAVPDKQKQDEVASKVAELEGKIVDAEKRLEVLKGKTTDILNKYLQ